MKKEVKRLSLAALEIAKLAESDSFANRAGSMLDASGLLLDEALAVAWKEIHKYEGIAKRGRF